MTRIRYQKVLNGLVAGPFKTPDNELAVTIAENGLVKITNFLGGTIYNDKTMASSVKSRTIPNAKKFAKKALQALGVVFESEVRPRIDNQMAEEEKTWRNQSALDHYLDLQDLKEEK